MRTHVIRYALSARPVMPPTGPLIYAVLVPLAVLDLFLTVYQAACFAVYGVEKARRGEFLIFDRGQLAYLHAIEKLNRAYCSYANGLIGYPREIAGHTEQYWCPIEHARRVVAARQCTTPRSSTTAMPRTIRGRCRTCAGPCIPVRTRNRTTAIPAESHCGMGPRLRTGRARAGHEVARRSDFLDPPRVRPDNRPRTFDAGRSGRAVEHRRRRGAVA
jgi:hypothetical protein